MKSWILGTLVLVSPAAAQRIGPAEQIASCLDTMRDQATGNCVGVSSMPTMGMLFPLGPELYFDSTGALRVERIRVGSTLVTVGSVIGGSLVGDSILAKSGGFRVTPGASVAIGEIDPQADLHIENIASAEIIVEADWNNSGEFDHPKVTFSQDGGAVQAFVGFQDGANDFALRSLYSGGGLRFDLHTSSTRDWEFRRRATAGFDVEARLTQSGALQLDGSVSSPAADLAEFYPVAETVEPGDVVAFSGQGLSLERARSGVDGRLAGVVSSRPAFTMGLSYTREDEPGAEYEPLVPDEAFDRETPELRVDPAITHEIEVNRRAPLALSGRVPCKVSDENGPIRPGDQLTVSSIPGRAMRATDSGAVVGTALEAWSGGEGTILVFANLGWFSPSEDLERRMAALELQVQRLLAR